MSIGSLVASGPLLLALPVAAAAGAMTFLSPCVLPLVPGYLSYVTGMSGAAVAAEPEADSSAESAPPDRGSPPGAGAAGGEPGPERPAAGQLRADEAQRVAVAVRQPASAPAARPARGRTVAGTL